MPTQPTSPRRSAVRAQVSGLSQSWADLTAEQQTSWSNYALAKPRKDKLGQTIFLTGAMTYIGYNAAQALMGLAVVTDPPPNGTLQPRSPAFRVKLDATECQVLIPPDAQNGDCAISISNLLSMGVSFNKAFRYVATLAGSQSNYILWDITGQIQALIGTVIPQRNLWFRATQYLDLYAPSHPVASQTNTNGGYIGFSNLVDVYTGTNTGPTAAVGWKFIGPETPVLASTSLSYAELYSTGADGVFDTAGTDPGTYRMVALAASGQTLGMTGPIVIA
jgi:hypothetical protein